MPESGTKARNRGAVVPNHGGRKVRKEERCLKDWKNVCFIGWETRRRMCLYIQEAQNEIHTTVVAGTQKAATKVLALKKQKLLPRNIVTKESIREERKQCQKVKEVQEGTGSENQRSKSRAWRTTYPNHGGRWRPLIGNERSRFHHGNWKLDKSRRGIQRNETINSETSDLTAPKEKEELIMYLAAAKEAISTVLMTERDGKQVPVYFVSCALQGPEINYTPMEKLILVLVSAKEKTEQPQFMKQGTKPKWKDIATLGFEAPAFVQETLSTGATKQAMRKMEASSDLSGRDHMKSQKHWAKEHTGLETKMDTPFR
nr:reverse transcriptase domain-containing protein [Tanacetum cinerariifolium]